MGTRDTTIGRVAVKIATQGENTNTVKRRIGIDWKGFGHFIGVWIITWLILFVAIIIITSSKNPENILRETVKTIDMLNMSFSLVLSAMLEQIWSKETVKNAFYKIMQGCEIALTCIGCMLYVAYSILPNTNSLLQKIFEINLGYAIASSVVVALGFLSRSLVEKI